MSSRNLIPRKTYGRIENNAHECSLLGCVQYNVLCAPEKRIYNMFLYYMYGGMVSYMFRIRMVSAN